MRKPPAVGEESPLGGRNRDTGVGDRGGKLDSSASPSSTWAGRVTGVAASSSGMLGGMTKTETKIAMAVLMVGGAVVCGLVVSINPSNKVLSVIAVVILICCLAAAIKLGTKRPTDGRGSPDQ